MEQERLRKAFNIKETIKENTPTETGVPNLDIVSKVLASRKRTSISPLLDEIKEAIDSGKLGVAKGKIDLAEGAIKGKDVAQWERKLLTQYEDMLE